MNDYNWRHVLIGVVIVCFWVFFTVRANAMPLPKDVLTTDTKTVCVPGYAGSVRDVSVATKKEVYKRAGIVYGDRSKCSEGFEVDHRIPLSLGGNNSLNNLQLQSYCGPRNAHDKDKDEWRLYKDVCLGKININKAQQLMREWK